MDTDNPPGTVLYAGGEDSTTVEPVACSVATCANPVAAAGLCWKHYSRHRRHGDVHVTLRRYGKTHKCRFCGTRNPDDFYEAYKSICKSCRKLRMINGANRRAETGNR